VDPNDLLAASPKLQQLQSLQQSKPMAERVVYGSPFHDRIAQVYSEGAGIVVAANLEKLSNRQRQSGQQGLTLTSTKQR
jgi:hypothetical protein